MSSAIRLDAPNGTTKTLSWLLSSTVGPQVHLAPEMGSGGGEVTETLDSIDDAADALLRRWTEDAPKEPSDKDGEEDNREDPTDKDEDPKDSEETPEDEGDEDESDEEADEDEDNEDEDEGKQDKKKPATLEDSAVVKIQVDGKELDVPVKDLKRLYGQEAALTRKSQEAATLRKKAEEIGTFHITASEALLERARERFAPYAEIDWLVAAKQLDEGELTALRSEAQKAYEDVSYLEKDVQAAVEKQTAERQAALVTEARATLKELQDPVKGIPGFNEKMYDEMRVFAINSGVPEADVNTLVSAPLLRLLNKAWMADKASKTTTIVKDKKNKKIIKSKVNSETTRTITKDRGQTNAMNRFKKSGSVDDAAEALMARWTSDED